MSPVAALLASAERAPAPPEDDDVLDEPPHPAIPASAARSSTAWKRFMARIVLWRADSFLKGARLDAAPAAPHPHQQHGGRDEHQHHHRVVHVAEAVVQP